MSEIRGTLSAAFAVGTAIGSAVLRGRINEMIVGAVLDRKLPSEAFVRPSRGREEEIEYRTTHRDRLETRPHEKVSVTARDGTTLVGHLYRVTDAKRIIIAMHGWRSEWGMDFGMSADLWENAGCTVLYVEERGQGESGGDFMGFGLTERYDCIDWVRYITSHVSADLPVYLVGISMGASAVLMAAGLPDVPESVHGVIADCAFTSPEAIWRHVTVKRFHVPYAHRRRGIGDLCEKKIGVRPDSYSTVDAVRATHLPVLFIHGTDDRLVPVSMTLENYTACVSPKHLLLVPGADHGQSYPLATDRYTHSVTHFFELYDKKHP